MKRCRRS